VAKAKCVELAEQPGGGVLSPPRPGLGDQSGVRRLGQQGILKLQSRAEFRPVVDAGVKEEDLSVRARGDSIHLWSFHPSGPGGEDNCGIGGRLEDAGSGLCG
jgi:hypothetical protein